MEYIIILLFALPLIIFFVIATKRKSKWGLNIKGTYCPSCKAIQPIIRSPKNAQQAMFGCSTCRNCNTALDKYGQVISK